MYFHTEEYKTKSVPISAVRTRHKRHVHFLDFLTPMANVAINILILHVVFVRPRSLYHPASTLSTSGIHSQQHHYRPELQNISLPDVYLLQLPRHLLNIDQSLKPFFDQHPCARNACHNVKVRFPGAYCD